MIKIDESLLLNANFAPHLNNTISYIREENEDYVSILLPNSKNPVYELLNSTTMEIIDKMDGERCIEKIYNDFIGKYSSVDINVLKNDFINIITVLSQKGIITWKDGINPFMETLKVVINDLTIRVAYEEDISNLIEYFNNPVEENLSYESPNLSKQLFDMLQLRYALFNMNHSLFIIEKKNKIDGLICISYEESKNIAIFTYININNLLLDTAIRNVLILVKEAAPYNLTKARLYVPKNNGLLQNIEAFKCVGFKFVAHLEKEFDNIDADMYDCLL